MQVLNFAYGNKEFIDLLTFGEKDVDYTSDENGVITVGQSGYGAQVYGSACWQMGNHYINSVTDMQVAGRLSDIGNVLKMVLITMQLHLRTIPVSILIHPNTVQK